jgi:hypothetical protein
LTAGIIFGSLDPGVSDNNATGNYNATDQTQFWVVIQASTNTPIDICTKVNNPLTHTDGITTIPNSGFTWNVSTTNDATNPALAGVAIDTTYDTTNLIADDTESGIYYLRYWLDVATGQKAGDYDNTVYICGQENETTCGTMCT